MVQGPRARAGPRRRRPVPGLAPRQPPQAAGDGAVVRRRRRRPTGRRSGCTGYADRLELDAAGDVVVVDLKTGRSKPTDVSVRSHAQLSLYQYAVDHGAVADLLPEGAPGRAAGAELVQLGILDDSTAAVVQAQAAHEPERSRARLLRAHLARAAHLLREETFPAIVGAHCRDCAFVPICPIKSAGSVTDDEDGAPRRPPSSCATCSGRPAPSPPSSGRRSRHRSTPRSWSPAPGRARPPSWPRGWSTSWPPDRSVPARSSDSPSPPRPP